MMKEITVGELKQMQEKEGIVFQGCGEDCRNGKMVSMNY